MSNSLRPIATAFVCLLIGCSLLSAQQAGTATAPPAANPPPAATAESPPTRVEESRPSVYYLPDRQGNLQPVLDFKYQDFVELYKLKNQLGRRDEPPRYSLQRMTATGTAAEESVDLNITFEVLVRGADWVRVPLRLDQGLLHGAVKYKGSGEQFVHYEGEGEGYVCWVRGKPDTQHEITLSMLVPLVAMGDETRLKLFAPRAAESELRLTVPMAGAVAKLSDNATLLPAAAPNSASTEFNVVGLSGDFQLSWHKPNPHAAEAPLVLEATGTVLTRLDGRSISAEATLSVRSYGAAFDRFTVRLPPGTQLSPSNPDGYVLTPVVADGKQQAEQHLVEVRLSKKTIGPVEVRLACRRDYDPLKAPSWCELAGFEVLAAARQWGTVAVAADGDWQILWGASSQVRQVEQLPESLRKEDVVAAFEYSTQPYALSVRLVLRKTHISVDPHYVLLVDRDRLRLEGKLTYTVRGAKIAALGLAMPGWELDEVGPDSLVAIAGVTLSGDNAIIPLVRPSSGTMELQLRAHRVIEAGAKSLSTALPQPQAGSVGPVSLVVVPADNVELTPNQQALAGLVPRRIASALKLPERQQEPISYHGTVGAAVFAADFRVHAQQITVDVASQVTLGQHAAEVEQRQSYSIAYEPVDYLTIAVPRTLAAATQIQVLCEGKPLVPVVATDDAAGGNAAAPISMRVVLPGPRIANCELVLRYSVAVAEPTPQQAATLAVPLPMPQQGKLLTNTLSVKAAANIDVSPRKGTVWTVVSREASAAGGPSDLRFSAPKPIYQIDLDLRREANNKAATTIVDRAWIQSWLTSVARQDRAAFQFTTNRREIDVLFPAGAATSDAVVLVNGQRVEGRTIGENRLLIPLAGHREGHRFVVELQYQFTAPRPPRGAFDAEFPQLGANAWVRRMYWQLVLPANEHVTVNPAGFTGEFTWDWQGYFWGRQPLLDQSQLESWVGATPQQASPENASVYLFSTLGNVPQAEIHTASRTWIVLLASGAALVAGLLLIYVPFSRHPATLLVVGLGLLATGLIAPEPTLLLAQAASLGLVLTLLAGLLERSTAGRRRRTAARAELSSVRVELGSTRSRRRVATSNGVASTEIMPAISPPPSGNANP